MIAHTGLLQYLNGEVTPLEETEDYATFLRPTQVLADVEEHEEATGGAVAVNRKCARARCTVRIIIPHTSMYTALLKTKLYATTARARASASSMSRITSLRAYRAAPHSVAAAKPLSPLRASDASPRNVSTYVAIECGRSRISCRGRTRTRSSSSASRGWSAVEQSSLARVKTSTRRRAACAGHVASSRDAIDRAHVAAGDEAADDDARTEHADR